MTGESEMGDIDDFNALAQSYGLGMAIMMLTTAFFARLYFLERAAKML